MSSIYRIVLKDEDNKTAYTYDLAAAKDFIFKRYDDNVKVVSATSGKFYWGIYDKHFLEPNAKLLCTIHELELCGKRLKFN